VHDTSSNIYQMNSLGTQSVSFNAEAVPTVSCYFWFQFFLKAQLAFWSLLP